MTNAFRFEITHQSGKSGARTGLLHTPHGTVETPAFVPVATRGALRLLDSKESADLGSQLYICNTFHLNLSPGPDVVAQAGGLQGYTHLNKPLFTDSGGFQVYSLGFGSDHSMGKILTEDTERTLEQGASAKNVKITEEGAHFRSPIQGDQMFLSPESSIEIQEKLGADVMFAFDECPSPLSSKEYLRQSVDRTHRWAQRCIDARDAGRKKYGASSSVTSIQNAGLHGYMQALYGIVQGGAFEDMRVESARTLGSMDFEGFGIGGEFGYDKESLEKMLHLTTSNLPNEKPRHVLGVGHPEDFEYIARGGGDTFDCIAPTHYARRGVAFVREGEGHTRIMGRLDLRNPKFLTDYAPLDPSCACPTCRTYTRSFISHLIRSNELTGMKLATVHNVFYLNALAAEVRERIQKNEL